MSRIIAWLTLFVVGSDLFVISPLLPDVRQSLMVSVSAAGWAVTVFALAYLVGGFSLGSLADRVGRWRVLTVALAVFAAANLLTGLSATLVVLLIARAIAGLAASGITPSVYALISASAPPERRGSWLSVVTSGLLIAVATGAPAGALIGAALGWQSVFFVLAGVTTLMLVIITSRARPMAAHMPQTGPDVPPVPDSPAAPAGLLARLRAVSVTTLWALAVYGPYTWLGTILKGTLHLSAGFVAAALACYGVGAVISDLAGGRLTDRFGGRLVSLTGLALLAVALAALGLALNAPVGVLLVLLAVFSLVAYPYFPAQQARLVGRFTTAAASVLAWNNSALYTGLLVASALGGPLLNAHGARALIYGACGVAVLAAIASTMSISPRYEPSRTTRSDGHASVRTAHRAHAHLLLRVPR
jgi:predicted MFS family arabinose efflux permease